MAEQNPIVADPISSDGSEDSWILLDEMEEAMNDVHGVVPVNTPTEQDAAIDESDSALTSAIAALNEQSVEVATEALKTSRNESDDFESKVDTLPLESASENLSNDEDDEHEDTVAHPRSGINNALLAYDDGSTTDGSISILGDHEFYQSAKRSDMDDVDDLSSHTSSPQPSHLWLRCTPVDMTICSKRPLSARTCERPTSVDELGLPQSNIVEDILCHLERFNTFLANTYLMHVLLLFLTGVSVTMLAIVYSRYNACKLDAKDVQQKLFNVQLEKYQLEGKLARCEYRYETDVTKKMAATLSQSSQNVESNYETMPAVHESCDENDINGECIIQPTKLVKTIDDIAELITQQAKTVWTGDGDVPLATKMPFESKKYDRAMECDDENGLFHEFNREYCEKQKSEQIEPNVMYEKTINAHDIIYPTQYSYKTIEPKKKCDLKSIDLNLGLDYAKKILRETNCDDERTLKHLHDLYNRYVISSSNQRVENPKREHKHEKSKNKRAKKSNHDRNEYNGSDSDEEFSDVSGKKDRHDKKQRKDKENRKQNNHNDRKSEDKKHSQEKENVWKNNERKRDIIKVYDQRSHDD